MTDTHAWARYVALGDSFTEGIGDPDPRVPGGHRGWADRVAEQLATSAPAGSDFLYANLAIRGRLLDQIVAEQLPPAMDLAPDLVSLSAGGNDILRPRVDPDSLADRLETAVCGLQSGGAAVLLFTGPGVAGTSVMKSVMGRARAYNDAVREIAARRRAILVDLDESTALADPRMWSPDRLHPSSIGHQQIAHAVLNRLGIADDVAPVDLGPLPAKGWVHARRDDAHWARVYFAPWIVRRLRGTSSGDGITAKRPTPTVVERLDRA
jgi:lysophospholipase L1-like esterase